MQSTATRLLSQFDERTSSEKITLKKAGVSSYNEDTRETEFSDPQLILLTGVATSYDLSMINGTTIQQGDLRIVITNAQEPSQEDKILLDGFEWSIVSVTPSAYTGLDKSIAYTVQIRK